MKLESTWMNFLRKLVRSDFERVNAPLRQRRNISRAILDTDEGNVDWSYRYTLIFNTDTIYFGYLNHSIPIRNYTNPSTGLNT